VACALLALSAPPALAHAALLDSTPAPGARVERTPPQISLNFTEPLNRRLSKASLVTVSGHSVAVRSQATNKQLVLEPLQPLARGAYRLEWHTVSTEDGHALEGSFGFGVRTAAVGGDHQLEQSPLARGGWLRIVLRGLFYASLFFFAGGLLVAATIRRGARLGEWLVPRQLHPALAAVGREPEPLAERVVARTLDAGVLALAAAVAVTLEEAADAAGGLSFSSLRDYLLTNNAGVARVATVLLVAAAVTAARRLPRLAVVACILVFLTIALGGHANSAQPRLAAILTDWVHLIAGALWLGGLAQIGVTWLPQVRTAAGPLRLAVMREVLKPFGRVALPAFLTVLATGLVNALIQLGRPSALWQSSYGRVLAVKIGLVGLIALASYLHALRLRPRLLAANPHPPARRERQHWRLLGAEPLLAVGVAFAAATLVAFPLPPRQLQESDQADSSIVAAWLGKDGVGLTGRLQLIGLNQRPVRTKPRLAGASLSPSGPGRWRFRLSNQPATLAVSLPERGRLYTAHFPARWQPGASKAARRLLDRAQTTMRNLRTVKMSEALTSGPGSFVTTRYRLQAPDRSAYRTAGGFQSIITGIRQYSRTADAPWKVDRFGGGGPGFRSRSFFAWTNYAQVVRLLGEARQGGRRVAELALMSPGTPLWYRLSIDLTTRRLLRVRMITGGHFMSQRFSAFNQPLEITAPKRARPGP
jgi:copper transport protein